MIFNQPLTLIKEGEVYVWGQSTPKKEKHKGRIDYRNKFVISSDGKELVSFAQITLSGNVKVNATDKIQWTDYAGNVTTRHILEVQPLTDLSGKPMYIRVFC
jgi:hypothetical protein